MKSKQLGLALPTLMVMMSAASLAALLAMRNLWVNDQLLNAEEDYLRSLHLAQAVLPIAVQDITNFSAIPNLRHTVGSAEQTHTFFPVSMSEFDVLQQRLGASTCQAGICAPSSTNTWTQTLDWKAQTASAISVSATDSPYGAHTAWYWVEIFPQEHTQTFVYRITAMAIGVRPGSATVLQGIWMPNTPTSTTGQWHSWHVLQD